MWPSGPWACKTCTSQLDATRQKSIGRSRLFKKRRTTPSWSVLGVCGHDCGCGSAAACGCGSSAACGCGSSAACGCGSSAPVGVAVLLAVGVAVLLAVGVAVLLAVGVAVLLAVGVSAVVNGWVLLPLQSSSKKKREVERCTTIIQGLKAELAAQETNQRLVLARLEGEKEGWFSTGGGGVGGGHREGCGLRKTPPMVC